MALRKIVRRNYGRRSPVSIKYKNLNSFNKGVILLYQSILETRSGSHWHGSALFTIPLNLLLCRLRFLKKKHQFFWCEIALPQFSKEKETYFSLENTPELQKRWSLALSARNVLSHLQFFKVCEIMVLKYGHMMLPGAFSDKVTPDINFTNEIVA